MPDPSSPADRGIGPVLPVLGDPERDALRRHLDGLLAQPEPQGRAARRRRRAEIKLWEWAIEWHDMGDERPSFVRRRIMLPAGLVMMLGPVWGILANQSHTVSGYAVRIMAIAVVGVVGAWVTGKVTSREMERHRLKMIARALEEGT